MMKCLLKHVQLRLSSQCKKVWILLYEDDILTRIFIIVGHISVFLHYYKNYQCHLFYMLKINLIKIKIEHTVFIGADTFGTIKAS